MESSKKLKLFISYSHEDNKKDDPYIEQFRKHIIPLRDKGLIEDWYDREILPGSNFEEEINNHLKEADIICLFISANFLSSESCKKEKKEAFELRRKKGIAVIPIILSDCGWKDDKDIFKFKSLALPTDGKPISTFSNRDEAWQDVYKGLKRVIEIEKKIRALKLTEEFKEFLQDVGMLATVHSQKAKVLLDDIFIYPELKKYNDSGEFEGTISSEELVKNILDYPKTAIAGESQSGKTTLCKIIFKELRKKNFIPVYISDGKSRYKRNIENKIRDSFYKQYNIEGIEVTDEINKRIIPILDDFHLAKNKEKHIKDLSKYPRCILIIDDIFSLNIKDEKLIGEFAYFRICEFKPSLRYELIKKWVSLRDMEITDLDFYKEIDKKTELIDSTLGKIIGQGIVPSYPFFILSTIFAYEMSEMPLNQEITSQGYCYQAFIYFYLSKQGVKNDEIDIYVNFLTELAFFIYKQREYELSPETFNSFMKSYLKKYTLPIKRDILLKNLDPIISRDSFNNYSFRYPYLYYFFVAKYLAEHIENPEIIQEIGKIMKNLHIEENAYIAVFLTHHSKSPKILEDLILNAMCLFDKYKPATLAKDEVKFLDEQTDIIIKAALPTTSTPEKERAKALEIKDKMEQNEEKIEKEERNNPLEKDLRRAIKTAEVMGCIIKSRVGSLEKVTLINMFKEGMNIHLRILSSLFEIIKSEKGQRDIIEFISKRLKKIIAEKENKKLDDEKIEKIEKIAKKIFWNLNFLFVYGIIHKIIHSLGSDKLYEIIEKIDEEVNTPTSFLVKHGVLMWYNKNLQVNKLTKRIKGKDFSETARNILKLMVANYCLFHPVTYKKRQLIESKLKIPKRKLMMHK